MALPTSSPAEPISGYIEVLRELKRALPDPSEIQQEQDKRDFAKLFGEYLRMQYLAKL